MHANGSLRYRGQVIVPRLIDLREEILREFYYSRFASRWYEDVPRSSSSILLKWDEETCWGLRPTMPHISAGKG